ncbi:hypothetical protein B0T22DRAFT_93207 [Podospora appendiculata]|uniref:Mid2 domain-containing protein n=1 Tax=Podospora appendiculata TaxID=314037 RepID=A0AAE1CHQ8_9PEZI|nr:hypothetical protein B0T22DRAFT_93207 [Podospora appendiculata]
MMRFATALLVAKLVPVALAASGFISPQVGSVYVIGETQRIKFTTDFTNYTIALWQQAPAGGSANLGPVIFRESCVHYCLVEMDITGFDWVVQTYNLDFSFSNKFFFWLFEGDSKKQGDQAAPNRSSAYVLFKQADTVSSSSSTSSTQTSTTSTSTSTSTSTTASSTGSTSSPTASPGAGSTGNENAGQGSSGLSVGAQAGIAVGASLAGIAAIVALIFWIRHLKKNQRALETRLGEAGPGPGPAGYYHPGNASAPPLAASREIYEPPKRYEAPVPDYPPTYAVNGDGHHGQNPVEMG